MVTALILLPLLAAVGSLIAIAGPEGPRWFTGCAIVSAAIVVAATVGPASLILTIIGTVVGIGWAHCS